MEIKEEVEFVPQYVKIEKEDNEYEMFQCKNEEIDLKIEKEEAEDEQ